MNEDLIEMKWVCDQTREVPRVGVLSKGDTAMVPRAIADNLQDQGLMKPVSKKAIKAEGEE